MSNEVKTDVVIIGAGPVGLFAVFQCGMLGMSCHVIDSLEDIGGQCSALYPEKPIYDIPAYPCIEAGVLIDRLEEQIKPFSPVFHMQQQAVSLNKEGEECVVTTSKGKKIRAGGVIIAAGAGAFGANKPPLDNLEEYEDKSVFYMVRKINDFKNRHIVIAGGGDSAVDWAVALANVADKVYVIHRRDKFRATPDMIEKMYDLDKNSDALEIMTPYQLKELHGRNGQLESIDIIDFNDNIQNLKVDTLLPLFGLSSKLGSINNWGLDIEMHHVLVNPTTCETNKKGIFAIGDIASYPNKLKLILTGFSEAAMAAHAIYPYVFDGKELHFEHSTTKGISKR